MDHRGFALSPGPVETSEFELDKIVDNIEILCQQLGFGRVMVIGHSGYSLLVTSEIRLASGMIPVLIAHHFGKV